jgi:hypothetical protein
MARLQLELSEPPDGITIRSTSAVGDATEIVLHCDAAKAKPRLKGNLIIIVFAERSPASGNEKPQANRRRAPIGTLPAIPFEIVTR